VGMSIFRRRNGWGMALALLALVGCATPKIDWPSRVGRYTFDQAVVELGPPDKQAKLSDGALVADWLTRRGRNAIYGTAGGIYGAPGVPYYAPILVGPGTPDYFLRLNFDAHGRLTAWKKYAQ
jgi:hypothetical protein